MLKPLPGTPAAFGRTGEMKCRAVLIYNPCGSGRKWTCPSLNYFQAAQLLGKCFWKHDGFSSCSAGSRHLDGANKLRAKWHCGRSCPALRCWGVGLGASLCGLVSLAQVQTRGGGGNELTHFCLCAGPCSDRQRCAVQAAESWCCSKAASLAEENMVLFSLLI